MSGGIVARYHETIIMDSGGGSGFPTVSFLEIDGKVLSGEEFEEYCRDHGLCRRCARVRTHRRVLKLFGRGQKWEPLTLHDDTNGDYTVYKGYCLKPTCYTLGQAKRLLGESGSGKRTSKSRSQKLKERLRSRTKKRPSSRRPKANPETGSVMSGADDYSIASDMSGLSQMSSFSAMSGMSGMSGFSFGGSRRKSKGRRSSSRSSASSSGSSVSSFDFSDDDTIDTAVVNPPISEIKAGEPSPIVSHRVEQLVMYDYFTVLDLSKVELRSEDIDAVVDALRKSKTLESVTMDKCKLKDEGVEKIANGLRNGNHLQLKKVSLRQNAIGNKGAQCLDFLFRGSSTLEELDLSENSISSRGAGAILTAFHENTNTVIQILNLSQNEIWDMDDGSFLSSNKTLKVLNLDGNFMHDEGAEQIARAISVNRVTVIEKLFIGWNGISDEGATALAKMMEENSTLQVLGLAENDISNTGARAILSALAVNTSVREISGLYHNQIDRKFIIVAIKRLLHRYGERTGQPAKKEDLEASLTKMPTLGGIDDDGEQEAKTEEGLGDDDDESQSSSVNWAAQLYSEDGAKSEEEEQKVESTSSPEKRRSSVALEAIEHWDWGTFGIEEIEAAGDTTPSINVPEPMPDIEPEPEPEPQSDPKEVPPTMGSSAVDRIAVFQSAPLAYFDRSTTDHHEVPILDFDYEAGVLKEALEGTEALGGGDIEIFFENATSDRFNAFFSQKLSSVMHISCHGHPDCLALENGYGYMQALPVEDLKRQVQKGGGMVKVVFVSSCYPEVMAKAFLDAGVPHVISVQREAVFRDEGPAEFAKAFYLALAQDKTVKEAFNIGFDYVQRSPLVKTSRNLSDRYKLLPRKPELNSYHSNKVFFQSPVDHRPEIESPDMSLVPKLPDHFVGREVDMYEILESLRVDDVIRVGGEAGIGKKSVLAAVSRYILERPKSFLINEVFWLPTPKGIVAEEDTLYADLVQAIEWMVNAEDDIWDEDDFTDCRERIMIELEDIRAILVIDGRIFTTEAAGENLERFLSHLLNEASVKIILITAYEGSGTGKTKRSRSQETIISIGPLSYKSTSLLFGNSCKYVSSSGNPVVHTAEEFADFLVPPSVKKLGAETKATSRRREELFERMGRGIPTAIMETAATYSDGDLNAMLRLAQRPEVQIESAGQLEAAIESRTSSRDKAVKEKNYLRAKDLNETLDELASLKKKYPSVKDLMEQERELKKEFTSLLGQKKYDDANAVKRKILALKKVILKEKMAKPDTSRATASAKLTELQAQMDKMVNAMQNLDNAAAAAKVSRDGSDEATFSVYREDGPYELKISTCPAETYDYAQGLSSLVCWTNENCDVSMYPRWGKMLEIGGESLAQDIRELSTIEETTWGPAKCAMGEAVIVGPRAYSKLKFHHMILAVSPLSPTSDDASWDEDKVRVDEDGLHYLVTGLRASYRSSFRQLKGTGISGVGIPTITTKAGGATYQATLRVGLQTVLEESKLCNLQSIHMLAASSKEATALIKIAVEMGLKAA